MVELRIVNIKIPVPCSTSPVRVAHKPERKVASTRYQTHNHQVMRQTRSPLSQRIIVFIDCRTCSRPDRNYPASMPMTKMC